MYVQVKLNKAENVQIAMVPEKDAFEHNLITVKFWNFQYKTWESDPNWLIIFVYPTEYENPEDIKGSVIGFSK